MSDLKQLRWQCRRGTLELDLILVRYLEQHYSDASLQQQQAFKALLNLEDSELLRYVLGERVPQRGDWLELLTMMKG